MIQKQLIINNEASTSLQLLHRITGENGDNTEDPSEIEEILDRSFPSQAKEIENRTTYENLAAMMPLAVLRCSSRGRGRGLRSRIPPNPSPMETFHESNSHNLESLHKCLNYEPIEMIRKSDGNSNFNLMSLPQTGEQLDFSLSTSDMKIIFDHRSGYLDALNSLKFYKIRYEPARRYADLWSFCLRSRTIRVLDPSNLILIDRFFFDSKKFWVAFERRPTFHDSVLNETNVDEENNLNNAFQTVLLAQEKFNSSIRSSFHYGALTSMEKFIFHPELVQEKRSDWKIDFYLKQIRLDRPTDRRTNEKIVARTVLRADLMDRTAIFSLQPNGFSVYIFLKGNPHEYRCTFFKGHQIERTSWPSENYPNFSTVAFTFTVSQNRSSDPIYCAAISQIKRLFKRFLDYFYSNRIVVCFGSIRNSPGPSTTSYNLLVPFKSSIQIYAFNMLRNVGYSVEFKIYENFQRFHELLIQLSGQDRDSDDRFYRLCLYLYRRSSEYHFLDLIVELRNAHREQELQLEQCQMVGDEMATILSPPRPNYAYIPSIRVTPTTILVQPLKLVKLHRVIREKNFDDPMSFALVEIRDEANRPLYTKTFQSLRDKFRNYLENGIAINQRRYLYLHHSMSQVKEKQFWFLCDKYSLDDVLSWMGNFDNERVVAKHAARIAQCFTSTEPSIRIPAEHVKYIPDIESEDKHYCFTDGVGVLSQNYGKQIQKLFNRRTTPSVIQIRYGGCKGTLSIDPALDNEPHQLIIRHSMLKFTSDHDRLEICKISSPRSLYLNRQDILLLSSRGIPESHFLTLQNENHLWLVQALLSSAVAFELLNDRVGPNYFDFREVANTMNIVEEPFFLQLLITCGHDCVSKFQQRAKIKVDRNKARNMFGTIDEYNVLNYGEVFIQYNHLADEKLQITEKPVNTSPIVLDNVRVVITKNPCHHPGDLRTFTAVDRPELRHLVDVVVFPQRGHRPHPNEISGSDLDGDEYAVIWDPALVPNTENDAPYDYDCQEKPIRLDRPVERSDINDIVLDIATQNLTGDMSNLHLAMADLLGTRHPEVLRLAGLISQELDAPKTGKHPITSEELNRYRIEILKQRYPDFMMKEHFKSYPSEKIIGQLYRSARRAIIRWHKATRTHYCLWHLKQVQPIDENDCFVERNPPINSDLSYIESPEMNVGNELSIIRDQAINHPDQKSQERWAVRLFSMYKETLRNIISVFNYQDEIDLFCRCESLDQLATGKQDINISASLELQRLIETTRYHFYFEFDEMVRNPRHEPPHIGPCTRDRSCSECKEIKLARAAACYNVCYSEASQQSTKARSRILSFPWLFSRFLTELKQRNESNNLTTLPSKNLVIGRAMRLAAKKLIDDSSLKLKILWPIYSTTVSIFVRPIQYSMKDRTCPIRRIIIQPDQEVSLMYPSKALFIEILNAWFEAQNVFGLDFQVTDKKPLIREICWHELLCQFIGMSCKEKSKFQIKSENFQVVFQTINNKTMIQRFTDYIKKEISQCSKEFDDQMYDYFTNLIQVSFQLARTKVSMEYAYLSDYLVTALQAIGIEKQLKDMLIDIDV